MKIPDETHYAKGERHVEDMPGFVLCTQCDKCPMINETTITNDGRWFCFYFQQWREGNDIIEYKCEGYRMKSCETCQRNRKCLEASKGIYCNRYRRKGMDTKGRAYVGRRRAIVAHDSQVIANEAEFIRQKYEEIEDEFL